MAQKAMTAASVNAVILSILARGDSYGYQIIKCVNQRTGGEVAWAAGSLYPVLHRLQADGLVASYWVRPPTGRKRKYYSITAQGQQALAAEKRQWLVMHNLLTQLWDPEIGLT